MKHWRLALPALLLAAPAMAAVPVPPADPRAVAYHNALDLFWLADQAASLAIPLLLLATRWGAAIANAIARRTHRRFWQVGLFAAAFVLIQAVLTLPLAWGEDFWLEHRYGMATNTLGAWFGDQIKSLAIGLVLTMLLAWLPYVLLRRRPRSWWWLTAAGTMPLLVLFIVIAPLYISPLFNTYTPLADGPLATSIHAQAARTGIGGATILVEDASRRTKKPNAYVVGLGHSNRIVLRDTLLAQMTPEEVLFVVGHETKHYLLGDIWKLLGFAGLVVFAGLFAVDRLGRLAVARAGARMGFSRLEDPASLPLFTLIFSVVSLVALPALNAFSRGIEHEADRFGLEVTQNNDAAANAFVKLQKGVLGVPQPGWLERTFRMNHPSLADRITFANDYHPWADGQPLRYGDRIGPPH